MLNVLHVYNEITLSLLQLVCHYSFLTNQSDYFFFLEANSTTNTAGFARNNS
jgi:hypothetical protein